MTERVMQVGVALARTLIASSAVVCVLATCVWIGSSRRPAQLLFDLRVGDRTYVVAGGAASAGSFGATVYVHRFSANNAPDWERYLEREAGFGWRRYFWAAANPDIDLQDGRRWLGVTAGHRRFVIPAGLRGGAPPAGSIDRLVVQVPAPLVVLTLAAVPTIWILRRHRHRRRRGFQVELPPCADAAAA